LFETNFYFYAFEGDVDSNTKAKTQTLPTKKYYFYIAKDRTRSEIIQGKK